MNDTYIQAQTIQYQTWFQRNEMNIELEVKIFGLSSKSIFWSL